MSLFNFLRSVQNSRPNARRTLRFEGLEHRTMTDAAGATEIVDTTVTDDPDPVPGLLSTPITRDEWLQILGPDDLAELEAEEQRDDNKQDDKEPVVGPTGISEERWEEIFDEYDKLGKEPEPPVIFDRPLGEPEKPVIFDRPLGEPGKDDPPVIFDRPLGEPGADAPKVIFDRPLGEPEVDDFFSQFGDKPCCDFHDLGGWTIPELTDDFDPADLPDLPPADNDTGIDDVSSQLQPLVVIS